MFKTTLIAGAVALASALPAIAEIEIEDAYARSASPMAKSGAAFMMISNNGGSADRLVAVSSDAAARTELHMHLAGENGVMRMVHVEEGFELPADGMIAMQRGGKHVMLMGLAAPMAQGDIVTITLTFEQAGDIVVEVPVDLERQDHAGMQQGSDS
ncbi:copper chaperone PCu(A)C [Marivita sp. XM-24bin2]|jgi:copper(I)-binding protein|uniref:copper chaperone PCu(A)C n=1 Tax=unclassified Marivita TaxID=2632480 RepID=UPI000D7B1510|nr:copper chaperone PCu(A)C [Marivita sp. XM-24bin2]MCR9109892.1 copper chaperone PCu(A)C [Paracoccaceae bacterium]PWL36416.1 MAG: copper-binding protein [Marivita sp. XM-24bin2]